MTAAVYTRSTVNQVRLTGMPFVAAGGRRYQPPPSKRTALLYYLAYQGVWVPRGELLYLFYPDVDEPSGRAALRPLLSRVRHLEHVDDLDVEPSRVRWQAETDVAAFREALRAARPDRAVEHYHGDLLAAFDLPGSPAFETWLQLERHELRREWRRASLALAARLAREERHDEAAGILEALQRADALDEDVLRWRLGVLARAGRRREALDAYDAFAEALAREVEGVPETETTRLIEEIRAGEVPTAERMGWQAAEGPASVGTRRLPVATTPFVGREDEIRAVTGGFASGEHGLLTLVGPGGIGKTRLALEVAARLEPIFEDGAAFAAMETVATGDGMVAALLDAVGAGAVGDPDPRERLAGHLRTRQVLLVLDNLEHLLDEVAPLAEAWAEAPGVKVLATSRRRLGLQGESVHDVGGLRVPVAGEPRAHEADALELLALAGRRVRADFRLDEDLESAVRVCRALGGMPLAIEMAAGWLRVMDLAEVATELESGIDLLHGGPPNAPERHQDLRTVFAASWDRSSPAERRALVGLSVFRGGFDRKAAREVTGAGVPMLLALMNHAFLTREPSGRFTLHPLLQRYVAERAEEEAAVHVEARARHAEYYAALLKSGEARLALMEGGRSEPAWLPELANLREAWFWSADHGREDLLEAAVGSLASLSETSGRRPEAAAAFAYAAEPMYGDSLARGRILRHLGGLQTLSAQYDAGSRHLGECIAIFRRLGARHDEALALHQLVLNDWYSHRGELDARSIWRRTSRLFREAGDRYNEARALHHLSLMERDPVEREGLLRRSVRLFRDVDGWFGLTLSLQHLSAHLCRTHGRYAEGREHAAEAVAIETAHGRPWRRAWRWSWQGRVALYRGRISTADGCFAEARAIGETLGPGFGRWEADRALWGQAEVARARGDRPRAERLLLDALASSERHPDPFALRPGFLLALGRLALDAGRTDEAFDLSRRAMRGIASEPGGSAGHAWDRAFCAAQLGDVALAEGDAVEAETQFRIALQLAVAWHLLPAVLHLFVGFGRLSRLRADDAHAGLLWASVVANPASMAASSLAARRELSSLPPDLIAASEARARGGSAMELGGALLGGGPREA